MREAATAARDGCRKKRVKDRPLALTGKLKGDARLRCGASVMLLIREREDAAAAADDGYWKWSFWLYGEKFNERRVGFELISHAVAHVYQEAATLESLSFVRRGGEAVVPRTSNCGVYALGYKEERIKLGK